MVMGFGRTGKDGEACLSKEVWDGTKGDGCWAGTSEVEFRRRLCLRQVSFDRVPIRESEVFHGCSVVVVLPTRGLLLPWGMFVAVKNREAIGWNRR